VYYSKLTVTIICYSHIVIHILTTSIARAVIFILGGFGQDCAFLVGLLPHPFWQMAIPDWLYANECLFHYRILLGRLL